MPGPSDRWRLASAEPLGLRCWDGDYVVFNPLSGQTHFLEILSGRILEQIMADTPTTAELCALTSTYLELDDEELVADAIDNHLYLLERVGLIEKMS